MEEKKSFIPCRLKNAAVGGHVAGTEDIYDDVIGKDQQVINSEIDGRVTAQSNALLQETSNRVSGDNSLQNQIDAGIREAEGLVFDTVPTKESANPVLSGGLYTSRKQMLESMAETRVTSKVITAYSLTGLTITDEGEISLPSSGTASYYKLFIHPVIKGTIIHATAGLLDGYTTTRKYCIGFSKLLPEPVDASTLVGIILENFEKSLVKSDEDLDLTVIAPFDGYLFRYYWSDGNVWNSSKSSLKCYPPLPVRNSDEEPAVNSQNWVTSGGVFEEFYKDRTKGKTLISTAMAQQNKLYLADGVVKTTTTAYIMLPYYPCVKGECFALKYQATTTGANISTIVFAVWTPSKPVAGVSYTSLHLNYVTDTDEHEIRLVAPDDGYIAVRWKWKEKPNDASNLANIRLCKWYDTSVVEPCVYRGLLSVNFASSNRSRVINADTTSQDFGNIITTNTNANVGISDFIDVEGLSWLKMNNLFVAAGYYYDKTSGSVFYDSDYNPLSVACYVQNNGAGGYETILVKVPENAKYLRLTGYQLTSDTWLPRCQYLEAWTTEKLNEKISVESTPKQDSTKLVESGGIFSAVDSLTSTLKSVIPTDGYFGASNTNKCSVSEQYVTFSKAEPIIYNVGDISNSENYKVKYIKQSHSKGTIVRIDATGSYSLNITVGFSTIDPAVYLEENGSLVGLEVQEPYSSNGINHFFNVVYPFDGWLVYRYYSTGSTWSRFYFTVYDGKDLSNVIDELMNYKEINIESIPERTYYINPESLKYGSNKNYKHAFLDLEGITRLKLTSNDKTAVQLAWLTNGNPSSSGGTPPILDGMVHVFTGTRVFLIPDGAMYAYIYKSSNNWASPKYIGIRKPSESVSIDMTETFANEDIQGRKTECSARAANMHLMPLNVPVDSNGWELPESVQMQNVLKKALQMINIRWTPKHNFPLSLGAYAPAGIAFTHGIPYTNNNSRFKRVGLEVSLHTFMTAINNPYSLCYTEQVDDVNHHSSWGEDYWATNGNGYYGTVCCAFTSAVLGIKFNVGNSNHYKSSKVLGLFTTLCKPLTQQNINYLRIGDIADDAKHSGLVFGLKRDANGNVTRVKWAEATGSGGGSIMGCHISDWTADYFINYINTHNTSGMTMFRYTGLYDNIDYETSPYVPLTDYGEPSDGVVYNNDICTFAGDKATFMKGNLVVLNYNLDSNSVYNWTGIEVYKNDVLLETYTLSQAEQSLTDFYANDGEPITPDPYNDGLSQSNHALVLGKSLDAGKYKARMINGSSYSDYTYWEVLNDTVTLTFNDNGSVSVDGGSNGKIAYIMIGYISDTNPNYMYHGFWHNNVCLPPTIFEEISNKITFYPKEFREKYNFIGSTSHIVVMKEGEYGLASTMPIAVSAPSGDEEPDDDGD